MIRTIAGLRQEFKDAMAGRKWYNVANYFEHTERFVNEELRISEQVKRMKELEQPAIPGLVEAFAKANRRLKRLRVA